MATATVAAAAGRGASRRACEDVGWQRLHRREAAHVARMDRLAALRVDEDAVVGHAHHRIRVLVGKSVDQLDLALEGEQRPAGAGDDATVMAGLCRGARVRSTRRPGQIGS